MPLLSPRPIQHHNVRLFLLAFKNNFAAIGGNIEVANVEASEAKLVNCRSLPGESSIAA